jgi:curli biogenesis system outer membrane secretion channel CsgG
MRFLLTILLLPVLTACLSPQAGPRINVEQDLFASRHWNLAVMDLDYTPIEGQHKDMLVTAVSAGPNAGKAIASLLANEFSRLSNIAVIERGQMEKLLQEQKLQMSGVSSESSAVEIGEIIGADAVVVGEVSDYSSWSSLIGNGSTVSFSARMIDVKTGKLIASGSISKIEHMMLAFQNAQNLAAQLVEQIAGNE